MKKFIIGVVIAVVCAFAASGVINESELTELQVENIEALAIKPKVDVPFICKGIGVCRHEGFEMQGTPHK